MNDMNRWREQREGWERRTNERIDRLERRLANERFTEQPLSEVWAAWMKQHVFTGTWRPKTGAELSPTDNHLRNDEHNQP